MKTFFTASVLSLCLCAVAATAEEKLRDLAPDRPDTTESAYTVDAGHWQLETSFADFTRDRDGGGSHTHSWAFADSNIKYGLTAQDDLQFVVSPFAFEQSGTPHERTYGTSDITLRWKHNFWGNDDGETAFALMPFLILPTGSQLSSDHLEGGLIAPLGWSPDWAEEHGLGFGFMLEGDAVWNDEDERYDGVLVHSATCGIDLCGPLGAFVEFAGELPCDGDYLAYSNIGFTVTVNDNLMFDVGGRFGLTEATPDLGLFVGMTFRY
ncbi:MAG: hypothetical protein A3K19_08540 [Lentisphaerae bacterium RIFOXYB12_FULL_65_16]|nr:MAG: hypothetical protein A3K18_24480 [Lentisphaerae bacterium RIFOXYA12_64_32]OGV89567.1 MAG: hypothetical protein A3K19_08540 [Lentisphaerae bacterium RIFOXYB12_FULL_65_16]